MVEKANESRTEKAITGQQPVTTLGGDLLSHPNATSVPNEIVATNTFDGMHLHLSNDDLYSGLGNSNDSTAQPIDKGSESHLHAVNMGTSAELANTVQSALDKLPPKVKQQLEKDGVQVYTFKDINQYDRYFGTNKSSETVDGRTAAAADATSLNDLNANPPRVAIFERTGSGDNVSQYDDIGGLTRHELGHVITNKLIPKPNSEDFDRQLAVIASAEGAKVPAQLRNGILQHYFHSGPAEIYAETFAMAVGGGSSTNEDRLIQRYFPQTVNYLRNEFASSQN